MNVLLLLFFASLLGGQLVTLAVFPSAYLHLHDLVLGGVYLWFAAAALRDKSLLRWPAIGRAILLFAAVCFGSIVIHAMGQDQSAVVRGLLYLARWLWYAGIVFVVVGAGIRSRRWLMGLFAFGAAAAAAGLAQLFLYPDIRNISYLGWDPYYYRVVSVFLDPNFAGIIFALTVFTGIYLARGTVKRRALILAGTALAFTALLLTFSRGSYLAFAAGITAMIVVTKRWKLAALLLGIILLVVVVPKPPLEALRFTREISALARVQNWQESALVVARAPLTGEGFGMTALPRRTTETLPVPAPPNRAGGGIDNSILYVLASSGVLGGIAFLFLIREYLRPAIALRKNHRGFWALYLASSLAAAFHSLFTNTLFYPWMVLWLFILAGVAVVKSATDGS
ncbi:O-antigen ligase family protein [Patescibacteria group bacterium]|nr:O-antigen ligase family protein [Patescibacteria group bacterium]